MRGNQTEAEDALSMAMLRAREAWRTSSKIKLISGFIPLLSLSKKGVQTLILSLEFPRVTEEGYSLITAHTNFC
jgi:hypothetical protein